MKIAIYPTSTSDETYYFVLDDNGILKCSVGIRHNDNIKRNNFIKKIKNTAMIKLTEQEVQSIMNMANELQASEYNSNKKMLVDTWNVALLYNNKVYEMNYWGDSSDI